MSTVKRRNTNVRNPNCVKICMQLSSDFSPKLDRFGFKNYLYNKVKANSDFARFKMSTIRTDVSSPKSEPGLDFGTSLYF